LEDAVKLCLVLVAVGVAVSGLGCATAVNDPVDETPVDAGKKPSTGTDAKAPLPQYDAGSQTPDTGTDDPPDTGSNNNCSLMINYGSNGCQSCMQACCTQDNTCASSSDCVAVINCLNGCQPNDSSCITQCRSQYSNGAMLLDGIVTCMKSQCPNNCP
jgi:hypothetical protein